MMIYVMKQLTKDIHWIENGKDAIDFGLDIFFALQAAKRQQYLLFSNVCSLRFFAVFFLHGCVPAGAFIKSELITTFGSWPLCALGAQKLSRLHTNEWKKLNLRLNEPPLPFIWCTNERINSIFTKRECRKIL